MPKDLTQHADVDWTLVRPMRLTDGPKTGRVRAAPYLPLGMGDAISRADVAELLVQQVTGTDWVGKAPIVAPER